MRFEGKTVKSTQKGSISSADSDTNPQAAALFLSPPFEFICNLQNVYSNTINIEKFEKSLHKPAHIPFPKRNQESGQKV